MGQHISWAELRDRRMSERGAHEAYETARRAFELGKRVRELREAKGWSQAHLGRIAGMAQPAIARFEAGDTIPTLTVLDRIAHALDADLHIDLTPHALA